MRQSATMTAPRARLLRCSSLALWLGLPSAALAAPSPAAPTAAAPIVPAPTDSATTDSATDSAPTDSAPTVADPPPVETDPAVPPMHAAPVPDPPPVLAATDPPELTLLPEPAPRHRLIYSNALVVRLNPLGLEDRFALMYRRRLSARTGKLWDDTYFGVGITPTFSPSITRFGPTVQLVPLAILQLRASYYFIGYYGSQKYKAHPFSTPADTYGPDTLGGRADAKQAINTYGGQAELSALLQVKFGPIALRNEVIFFHNSIKLPAGNDVFYDLRHDILAPARGWFLSNDTDLLYTNAKLRFNAGVRGTYYHVFYRDAAYEPGDLTGTNRNDHARVGPLVSYSFKDRPEKRFTKPTLFFAAQWWVKHRYRTGQEVSQALPMFVLGFSFTGELLARK